MPGPLRIFTILTATPGVALSPQAARAAASGAANHEEAGALAALFHAQGASADKNLPAGARSRPASARPAWPATASAWIAAICAGSSLTGKSCIERHAHEFV